MGTVNRITMTPGVCGGRPCIRGLHIGVTDILNVLAAGATREEILRDYPLPGEIRTLRSRLRLSQRQLGKQ
jgi:uncharacterized protein (DUF433 family)